MIVRCGYNDKEDSALHPLLLPQTSFSSKDSSLLRDIKAMGRGEYSNLVSHNYVDHDHCSTKARTIHACRCLIVMLSPTTCMLLSACSLPISVLSPLSCMPTLPKLRLLLVEKLPMMSKLIATDCHQPQSWPLPINNQCFGPIPSTRVERKLNLKRFHLFKLIIINCLHNNLSLSLGWCFVGVFILNWG